MCRFVSCRFAFIYVDKLSFVDLMLSLEYVSSHYYFLFVCPSKERVALALAIQQEFCCDNANNATTNASKLKTPRAQSIPVFHAMCFVFVMIDFGICSVSFRFALFHYIFFVLVAI